MFGTRQQFDRHQIQNLALIQPKETAQERSEKIERMRQLLERSQIGSEIVARGIVLAADQTGEPEVFAAQKVKIIAAAERGLVVEDQIGQVSALDYKTLEFPIIARIIEH